MTEAARIHVQGVVQGVGFRPFVYRTARRLGLAGWVRNAVDGVDVLAEGDEGALAELANAIANDAPAAARVKRIKFDEAPVEGLSGFRIVASDAADAAATTLVSPDLATCDDCVRELFDPSNRRYRYPFINCTACGPRFTIINQLPYDRPNTSMRGFRMCQACQDEYDDPDDRRFHAQPNACFECGPHISMVENPDLGFAPAIEDPKADGRVSWGLDRAKSDAILARAVELLQAGRVLAVKGLGGFHLVCDAGDEGAVALLRKRKRRQGKALAVMVASAEDARRLCQVSAEEERLLRSAARPIVLLEKRHDARITAGLADGLTELGVMLPATPLQHLLLHDFAHARQSAGEEGPTMLVMTSGNVHESPIQTDDVQAYRALGQVADAFIGNDRPIVARYDDSVARVLRLGHGQTAVQVVRRARGMAPMPVKADLGPNPRCVLATGPELKNTLTITRPAPAKAASGAAGAGAGEDGGPAQGAQGEAFVSQHIGDMENAQVNDAWTEAKDSYERLFRLKPQLVACDLHPEYLTTKWARAQELPVVGVQHHFAHVEAVMAEHGLAGPVCGVAFDGTGYGVDGALWGGEVLLCDQHDFERFANFAYFPLPGGTAAIKHTLRCAYGLLWSLDLLDHPAAVKALAPLGRAADACAQMVERGLNCPQTSSVGRLFDAASAILGVCDEPRYEGEGAVLLEAAVDHSDAAADAEGRYHVDMVKNTATDSSTAHDTSVVLFDVKSLFQTMLDDMADGLPTGYVARRFHDAVVGAVVDGARAVQALYGITTVALAGGVFLNRYVTEHAVRALQDAGLTVALPKELPPNDGAVSFGEAVVACHVKDDS